MGEEEDQSYPVDDRELGTAVKLLYRRGHHKAVEMLVGADEVVAREVSFDWGHSTIALRLVVSVDRHDEALDNDALTQIIEVFNEIWSDDDRSVKSAGVRPALVSPGWREDAAFLKPRVSNQAGVVTLPTNAKRHDNMWFRDRAEWLIYRALKERQESMKPTETLTIAVNPSIRVPGHTWEPDFVVVYRKRSGIIEVDGTSHMKKYASDKSRDSLLTDAGFHLVERIDVKDAEDEAEVRQFVLRFLERLLR